jgi:TetR/AcrR family tetracycline transcriptional repressor
MSRNRRRGPRRSAAGESNEEHTREPLDRERLVRAALALLDEVGLDGLSMRRLAERLDVKAASLYWHVQSKEELLDLLADAISGEIRLPAPDLPWRPRLEALLWEYRRVLLAHRDAARILAATLPSHPNRLRLVDITLGALLDAGFTGLDAARAGRLGNDYIIAFVLDEDNQASIARRYRAGPEAAPDPFTAVPLEQYPSIAALAPHAADPDADGRFRFGLTILFDGLTQHLAGPARSRDEV